jgi:hypothetical protein
MAETALLAAIQSFLAARLQSPTARTVGVVEPQSVDELPAVVLVLESSGRSGNGRGGRSALMTGALDTTISVDLANPVLPDDPSFTLLDATRRNLILPHGGLVRRDGTAGALGGVDLTVAVAGAGMPVVSGTPAAGQVSADPATGTLTFGAPLPPAGTVAVGCFLGQWEQRVVRVKGVLRADICAADAATAVALADATVAALTSAVSTNAMPGLRRIELSSLGSVGASEQPTGLRRRTARFSFDFESEDNRPDSSGGTITRIPINTRLGGVDAHDAGTVDTATVVVAG